MEHILGASWERLIVLYLTPLIFFSLYYVFDSLLFFASHTLTAGLSLVITLLIYSAAESKALAVYNRRRYPFFYPGLLLYNIALVLDVVLATRFIWALLLWPLFQYFKYEQISSLSEIVQNIKKERMGFLVKLVVYALLPIIDLIPPFAAVLHPLITG